VFGPYRPRDASARLNLDLSVGDVAGNVTTRTDQQPLADDEFTVKAAHRHLSVDAFPLKTPVAAMITCWHFDNLAVIEPSIMRRSQEAISPLKDIPGPTIIVLRSTSLPRAVACSAIVRSWRFRYRDLARNDFVGAQQRLVYLAILNFQRLGRKSRRAANLSGLNVH